jgi:hypothetical protein
VNCGRLGVAAEPANALRLIPLADTPASAVQGLQYTNFAKLSTAKKVAELF